MERIARRERQTLRTRGARKRLPAKRLAQKKIKVVGFVILLAGLLLIFNEKREKNEYQTFKIDQF
jgi:hypothetical protein